MVSRIYGVVFAEYCVHLYVRFYFVNCVVLDVVMTTLTKSLVLRPLFGDKKKNNQTYHLTMHIITQQKESDVTIEANTKA